MKKGNLVKVNSKNTFVRGATKTQAYKSLATLKARFAAQHLTRNEKLAHEHEQSDMLKGLKSFSTAVTEVVLGSSDNKDNQSMIRPDSAASNNPSVKMSDLNVSTPSIGFNSTDEQDDNMLMEAAASAEASQKRPRDSNQSTPTKQASKQHRRSQDSDEESRDLSGVKLELCKMKQSQDELRAELQAVKTLLATQNTARIAKEEHFSAELAKLTTDNIDNFQQLTMAMAKTTEVEQTCLDLSERVKTVEDAYSQLQALVKETNPNALPEITSMIDRINLLEQQAEDNRVTMETIKQARQEFSSHTESGAGRNARGLIVAGLIRLKQLLELPPGTDPVETVLELLSQVRRRHPYERITPIDRKSRADSNVAMVFFYSSYNKRDMEMQLKAFLAAKKAKGVSLRDIFASDRLTEVSNVVKYGQSLKAANKVLRYKVIPDPAGGPRLQVVHHGGRPNNFVDAPLPDNMVATGANSIPLPQRTGRGKQKEAEQRLTPYSAEGSATIQVITPGSEIIFEHDARVLALDKASAHLVTDADKAAAAKTGPRPAASKMLPKSAQQLPFVPQPGHDAAMEVQDQEANLGSWAAGPPIYNPTVPEAIYHPPGVHYAAHEVAAQGHQAYQAYMAEYARRQQQAHAAARMLATTENAAA